MWERKKGFRFSEDDKKEKEDLSFIREFFQQLLVHFILRVKYERNFPISPQSVKKPFVFDSLQGKRVKVFFAHLFSLGPSKAGFTPFRDKSDDFLFSFRGIPYLKERWKANSPNIYSMQKWLEETYVYVLFSIKGKGQSGTRKQDGLMTKWTAKLSSLSV